MSPVRPDSGHTGATRCTSAERVMWITPDRVLYVGLLGEPSVRTMGAIMVYVGIDGPLRFRCADGQQAGRALGDWCDCPVGEVAVVQPYVAHQVACEARHIAVVKIEPESVDGARLPPLLRRASGPVLAPEFAQRVRAAHARLAAAGHQADWPLQGFDQVLFGAELAPRVLDARIAQVLDAIKADPASPALAEDFAQQVGLSFSRFLHLFKQQVGAPYRSVRTWKRARSLLHYVNRETNLAHVALDAGYPDSSHFSHSIRAVYGLKPRDIFAGSRKLRVIDPQPPREGAMRLM